VLVYLRVRVKCLSSAATLSTCQRQVLTWQR